MATFSLLKNRSLTVLVVEDDTELREILQAELELEGLTALTATRAEYSPRLWPATKSGLIPFSFKTSATATETVRIAGWVFAVSCSCSAGPSKHNFESEKPRTRSAASKTRRAAGNASAS